MTHDPPQPTNDDVRMRGFSQRTTLDAAVAWLDQQIPHHDDLPRECVPLTDASRRVLGRSIVSQVDVPQFARAMMDGFAVRAEDVAGASEYHPLPLVERGISLPGAPWKGVVGIGEAVRIMTGAPMPEGADAVLPVEWTDPHSGGTAARAPVPPGKHVGSPGEDIAMGVTVLSRGRRLRPQDLGVLSSIGIARVEVVRRPSVRILITGNELLPMGSVPVGCQIADANGPMLTALVHRDGAALTSIEHIPDDRTQIAKALEQEADVILVSGGSSVGQEDHAPSLVAELGELAIHGVAMRPSSPVGMGRIGERLVFLLPGNPVSCLCAYDFFAGRALRRLGGLPAHWPYRSTSAKLSRKLVSQVGRVDYARVHCADGWAEPLAISGASVLSSTTRADGFIVVNADSEGMAAGSDATIWLYDE